MKKRRIIISALCCLLGLGALQAQETAQAADQASVRAWQTPAYDTGLYPQWSLMTPEGMVEDARAAIELARARLAAICAIEPGQETYENVFAALEECDYELERVMRYFGHLSGTMDNAGMRKAAAELSLLTAGFSAELTNNLQLWAVIKRAAAQPWVQELSPAKQRHVQDTVDSFLSSGIELPADKKARLQEIKTELSALSQRFSQNVQDAINDFQLVITDASQLDGMSEEWMKRAAADAFAHGFGSEEDPQWRISADPDSCGMVLSRCNVQATRKLCHDMSQKLACSGRFDNSDIVRRIVELRYEQANILGYNDYASYVCRKRMAGGAEKALAFVDGMMLKLRPGFEQENRELMEFISASTGGKVESVAPWDASYYLEKLYLSRFDVDPERMRDYMRSDNVLKGMFDLASRMYDITVEELPAVCLKPGEACPEGMVEVWHPDVQVFKVTDNKTGDHLGSFYFDPYPRASKRPGAWMCTLRTGLPAQDGRPHSPHLIAIVADLSRPCDKGYALYTASDVKTVFHEFGHALHALLSDTELRYQSCTAVDHDFVEMPSQFNERLAWEPEVFATFAFHHETGGPIPAGYVQQLRDSKHFRAASSGIGQLRYAKLDLELHMHYAEKFAGKSLDDATDELLDAWRMPFSGKLSSPIYMFSHIMSGGYAAGYYSYMWADALAADAFSRFRKDGITDPETCAAFRGIILKSGNSKPAEELYRDFMGRDPDPSALLEKYGVKPAGSEE